MYQLLTPTWQILTEELQRKALTNACRRGNAETEILLKPYVSQLKNDDERTLFARLLEQEDQALFEWMMDESQAPQAFRGLIGNIRAYYLSLGED
ncbi:succinate dehydrogenase assembly factor 2 [Hydrogenovibrio sp. JE_KL2]|uniref:FAD assembly factor SdhE n=1 Tax=Hydrogenovibrio sp. JE_KL2 TaxID=2651188 RepID=UPI00128D6758|nr:succinate dehydrogenase assembly factor 2 [Hydrogenovibrio sp. JE_KL2]MPQ76400.1 succinate dehydrogenase assembly factor 2 [Hydrogenovibrio sp. JE_KL2]